MILTLLVSTILLTPAVVFGADYVPLVGLPGVDEGGNFDNFIQTLYILSITIAALLAVIKIVIAGVKWMLSDVVTSKANAKKDINGALIGLLVVLGAVVILTVINPDITKVDLTLEPTEIEIPPDTGPTDEELAEQLAEIQVQAREINKTCDEDGICTKIPEAGDVTGYERQEITNPTQAEAEANNGSRGDINSGGWGPSDEEIAAEIAAAEEAAEAEAVEAEEEFITNHPPGEMEPIPVVIVGNTTDTNVNESGGYNTSCGDAACCPDGSRLMIGGTGGGFCVPDEISGNDVGDLSQYPPAETSTSNNTNGTSAAQLYAEVCAQQGSNLTVQSLSGGGFRCVSTITGETACEGSGLSLGGLPICDPVSNNNSSVNTVDNSNLVDYFQALNALRISMCGVDGQAIYSNGTVVGCK
ncbi:hypothetical protein KC851_03270 [Candidatus Kaiserbacteria bacterium]|nr:hypothetical protein [Candidatus Kaiserbacteria bacterium]